MPLRRALVNGTFFLFSVFHVETVEEEETTISNVSTSMIIRVQMYVATLEIVPI